MIKMPGRTTQDAVIPQSIHSPNVVGHDSSGNAVKQDEIRGVQAGPTPMNEKILRSPRRSLQPGMLREAARASRQPGVRSPSPDEQTLTKNLLGHLSVGSNDSLNILKEIFQFKGYDATLLDKYIGDKSPENQRALTIQIKDSLFVQSFER